MARVFENTDVALRVAARRAYEVGRLQGALGRGAAAGAFAMPALLICNQTPIAAVCLAGFVLAVAAARMRGEDYERGSRAGAIAGILPCLLPVTVRAINPDLCYSMLAHGAWLCGIGGAVAGVILGLRGRNAHGMRFWLSAITSFGLVGALGCLPAGIAGFAGLAAGLVAGGGPILVSRKALT